LLGHDPLRLFNRHPQWKEANAGSGLNLLVQVHLNAGQQRHRKNAHRSGSGPDRLPAWPPCALHYHNGNSFIGIGFSVFVVIIAALNLVLDFDFIETGVKVGAPKYMEWYGAFGIMVTLVWLYLEILRLLSKVRNRN
jgi:hypothetical protein